LNDSQFARSKANDEHVHSRLTRPNVTSN